MVKSLPGWANFLLLVPFYVFVAKGFLIFYEFAVSLIGQNTTLICIVFAGGYLAKWKFFKDADGNFWHRFV